MSRRNLILLAAIGVLSVVEIVAWSRFQNSGQGGHSVLVLHFGAAAATSLLCSLLFTGFGLSTRVTLVIFLAILTSVLPLAGIPLAGLLTMLVNTKAGDGGGPEDALVFGNPDAQAARRETREPQPTLKPLAELMRELDEKQTERMLHGLRQMSPPRKTLHFLRRFQADPKSSLQFASQAIIYSEFELREMQVKAIQARIKANPQAVDHRIQLAEVLLSMADWTPDGDSTALVYRRDALKHLEAAAGMVAAHSQVQLLQAKCHLGLAKPEKVLPLVDAVETRQGTSPESLELRMRALQDLHDYDALRLAASKVTNVPTGGDLAEALAFWNSAKSA